jgi:hypothetical protein
VADLSMLPAAEAEPRQHHAAVRRTARCAAPARRPPVSLITCRRLDRRGQRNTASWHPTPALPQFSPLSGQWKQLI